MSDRTCQPAGIPPARRLAKRVGRATRVVLRHLGHQNSVDELKLVAFGEDGGIDQSVILLDRHTIRSDRGPVRSGRRLVFYVIVTSGQGSLNQVIRTANRPPATTNKIKLRPGPPDNHYTVKRRNNAQELGPYLGHPTAEACGGAWPVSPAAMVLTARGRPGPLRTHNGGGASLPQADRSRLQAAITRWRHPRCTIERPCHPGRLVASCGPSPASCRRAKPPLMDRRRRPRAAPSPGRLLRHRTHSQTPRSPQSYSGRSARTEEQLFHLGMEQTPKSFAHASVSANTLGSAMTGVAFGFQPGRNCVALVHSGFQPPPKSSNRSMESPDPSDPSARTPWQTSAIPAADGLRRSTGHQQLISFVPPARLPVPPESPLALPSVGHLVGEIQQPDDSVVEFDFKGSIKGFPLAAPAIKTNLTGCVTLSRSSPLATDRRQTMSIFQSVTLLQGKNREIA